VLADNQKRRCVVDCQPATAPIPLDEEVAADIVNNLVGNVFRHTRPGTPLTVTVSRHASWVSLVVDDGGPGIADPEAALQRGMSGSDSTGLGLDIARTRVEATGGTIHIERGNLGGARAAAFRRGRPATGRRGAGRVTRVTHGKPWRDVTTRNARGEGDATLLGLPLRSYGFQWWPRSAVDIPSRNPVD
jgi:signal transduction histidine kinase